MLRPLPRQAEIRGTSLLAHAILFCGLHERIPAATVSTHAAENLRDRCLSPLESSRLDAVFDGVRLGKNLRTFVNVIVGLVSCSENRKASHSRRFAAQSMLAIVGRDQLIITRLIADVAVVVPPIIAVHRAWIITLERANGGLELTLGSNRRSSCSVDSCGCGRTAG